MTTRPILFSRPMVRALLAGEKGQTRRLLKRQPEAPRCIYDCDGADTTVTAHYTKGVKGLLARFEWAMTRLNQTPAPFADGSTYDWSCPYGNVGDELWCRETWAYLGGDEDLYQREPRAVSYRATWDSDQCWQFPNRAPFTDYVPGGKWRPSIFMPRWASRLTLRVTGIRVERAQSISEADAIAEGMAHYWKEMDYAASQAIEHRWDDAARAYGYEKTPPDYRGLYAVLWDQINGKRAPFASNPWTWVIDVERVTP